MANPPSHSARSPGTDTTNPTPKAEAAKGDEEHPTRWASIVLRGANDYMLDEMERSVHDCLCAVKRTLENRSVVPGGGAVEMAVSVYLENFATTIGSREQLALSEFAMRVLSFRRRLLSMPPRIRRILSPNFELITTRRPNRCSAQVSTLPIRFRRRRALRGRLPKLAAVRSARIWTRRCQGVSLGK